ncbi:hypothetical protein [Sigmofec virus UA08Rod_4577]|uniref:Uncharacterized protein n=1 Tax=Sigmofec virus UA08Rod_4577 TaxID=2929404 RepID=A0A976N0I0_9VIRU|nr:hypothetical protein [Sigmofec virus UA08Rod_4577]
MSKNTSKPANDVRVVKMTHFVEPILESGAVIRVVYKRNLEFSDATVKASEQTFDCAVIPFETAMGIISSIINGNLYENNTRNPR